MRDLCDTCRASGVEIDHTDDEGNTVCVDCAAQEEEQPDPDTDERFEQADRNFDLKVEDSL